MIIQLAHEREYEAQEPQQHRSGSGKYMYAATVNLTKPQADEVRYVCRPSIAVGGKQADFQLPGQLPHQELDELGPEHGPVTVRLQGSRGHVRQCSGELPLGRPAGK